MLGLAQQEKKADKKKCMDCKNVKKKLTIMLVNRIAFDYMSLIFDILNFSGIDITSWRLVPLSDKSNGIISISLVNLATFKLLKIGQFFFHLAQNQSSTSDERSFINGSTLDSIRQLFNFYHIFFHTDLGKMQSRTGEKV
ncbi:hypothetical protein BpHYR1_030795 [Brachionus plicatilis]|uniref:Uncharacterized protein n=1 Tax=Brachionus plicatilis TaxID=10195 RepID=A0A3M7PRE0_BRAPC|nr:hypothetical protein BpHYR1_030795 [Brachionus plicatilis]